MSNVDREGNLINVGDYLRISATDADDVFAIVMSVYQYITIRCLCWRNGRVQRCLSAIKELRVKLQPNEVPPEIRADLAHEALLDEHNRQACSQQNEAERGDE